MAVSGYQYLLVDFVSMSGNSKVEMADILQDLFGSAADNDSGDEDSEMTFDAKVGDNTPLSAVMQMDGIGGSRGLVALSEISPCVLLLAEIPSVTWTESTLEEEDLRAAVIHCLTDELAYATTKTLHPKSLGDCDAEEKKRAEDLLGADNMREISLKANVTNEEVLRVLLVLQHNGFGSGLYSVLTMLNHSCTPNCIKFSPSTGSSGASEIWTVRQIEKGEELTICYCEPLEMTKESMREFLEAHHRFSCVCSSCAEAETAQSIPDAKQHCLENVRTQERKLQEMIVGMEQELQFLRNVNDLEVCFESVARLMKASMELSSVESEECAADDVSVSPLVLARLCKLAANAAVTFLDYADKASEQHRRPKSFLVQSATFSFLRNSLSLLSHQVTYLGSYHPDIASSHIDIAEALDCALQYFPDELIAALNAPIDETYAELKLLKIFEYKSPGPGSEKKAITRAIIKKESKRFRGEGEIIKNLYSRRHFPSRYISLRDCLPGACHWGDCVPLGHLKHFNKTN